MATVKVPGTTVSLLTSTTKMPSKSWSMPAGKSCPSAFYGEGGRKSPDKNTICGNCYAAKGFYVWPVVRNAQEKRFQWAIQCSVNPTRHDEFVQVMTDAITHEAKRQERKYKKLHGNLDGFQPVFRVHDSGDLFSPAYVRLWIRVCLNLPGVKFWIPTRQYRAKGLEMQATLLDLACLPNVSLRPSALYFNDAAPIVLGMAAGTTASNDGSFTCPAPTQGGKCLECRACWSKDIVVSYAKH
jgi:hypothetical protein